ncbi:MAG: Coenzyme F420 hydrogenase/dehydrogenase, beta subunit C-terminal domain [Candidatus Ranarchaeia archaeon]|jgi:coenzyme F420 hydrogenase subunit beta
MITTDKLEPPQKLAFSHLDTNVISPDLCIQCGICVSVCPVNVIELQGETPVLVGECIQCGFCSKSCPQLYADRPLVEENTFGRRSTKEDPLGVYLEIHSARMKDETLRGKCQDGGATTAIVSALIEKNLIDGAIVSGKGSEPLSTKPVIATSQKEIQEAAGTRYSPSPNLILYPEAIREKRLQEIGYVGLPCHLFGFRRAFNIPVRLYSNRTKVTLGIFCMENFHHSNIIKEVLKEKMKLDPKKVVKVNMKKDFIVTVKGSEAPTKIPIRQLDPYVLKGCSLCEDLTSELADISIGAIGSEPGWNTVIIRNEKGKAVFDEIRDVLEVKPLLPKFRKTLDICSKRKRKHALANRKTHEET